MVKSASSPLTCAQIVETLSFLVATHGLTTTAESGQMFDNE